MYSLIHTIDDREYSYAEAINIAIANEMRNNSRILVYGLGVDDPTGMYGTTKGYVEEFGSDRCFDTPLSEDAMTGYGIGLAMAGYRPIHVHQRADFLLLCANQLINMAAKIKYVSNDMQTAPLIVRAIIGRSWGQGAQHSQSLYSLFGNIPGLNVMVPSTPQDIYNTYRNALKDDEPTLVIEHRMLYKIKSRIKVLDKMPNSTQIDTGKDLTICSVSHASFEAQRVCNELLDHGISSDHFSITNIKEWGVDKILASCNKTGRLLIIDNGWLNCSVGHSIGFKMYENGYKGKAKVIGYQNSPCPTAKNLEKEYYPDAQQIIDSVSELMEIPLDVKMSRSKELQSFKGPF